MKYIRPAYRDQIDQLSDRELLAHARHRYENPYMTLVAAKQMRGIQRKYLHLGLAAAQRRVEERAEGRHAVPSPARPTEAR